MTVSPTRRVVLRTMVSVSLLVLLAFLVDAGEVVARLSALRPVWVAAALTVSVLQTVVSAWRWRYTAGRLGIELSLGTAVTEYYLATFLNQVLPGGVLGDVSRAWRHSRAESQDGMGLRSVHAVVLERTSGQAVMTSVAVVAAGLLLLVGGRSESGGLASASGSLPEHPLSDVPWAVSVVAGGAVVVLGVGLLRGLARRAARVPAFHRLLRDARSALLGSALVVQAALSLTIVASYVAVFVLTARAVGVETSVAALTLLVPPVLVTMLVPVSVAGWGVREGAAALLWGAVGLTASDGVAISVAYGLLVLVASLPGAAVLALSLRRVSKRDREPREGRDRRGDRRPDGSGGPEAASPRPASRPPGG